MKTFLPFAALICFSFFLRSHAIKEMSPTFDEPFRVLQAVHFKQFGVEYNADVHPPFPSWLLAKLLGPLAQFEDLNSFLKHPEAFAGPYQYRMDILSNLPQDTLLIRARWISQAFWLLTWVCLLLIAKNLGFKKYSMVLFTAFFWLEPSLLGLSSLLCLDIQVVFWLSAGIYFLLRPKRLEQVLGLCFFSFAWATKFTAILGLIPIVLGLRFGRFPKRVFYAWGLSFFLSTIFCYFFFGFDPFQEKLLSSNFRSTYLDGVNSLRPAFLYFFQVFMNKLSYGGLFLIAFCFHQMILKKSQTLPYFLVFIGAFFLAGFGLPGLGLRLVLPLIVCIFFLASFEATPKMAYSLIALLVVEAFFCQGQWLSHQNLFAGTTPRSLDSDLDWGQGLKDLAIWREQNPKSELALSLFGGTPPETYGIQEYRSLPSFPILTGGRKLESEQFSGFVAVSRNFLYGYIVQDPNLVLLRERTPIQCFQGALCLFDVRDKK